VLGAGAVLEAHDRRVTRDGPERALEHLTLPAFHVDLDQARGVPGGQRSVELLDLHRDPLRCRGVDARSQRQAALHGVAAEPVEHGFSGVIRDRGVAHVDAREFAPELFGAFGQRLIGNVPALGGAADHLAQQHSAVCADVDAVGVLV
jgi:hypothetical protein